MKVDVDFPLLNRKWLLVGYALIPLPFILIIGSFFTKIDVGDYILDLMSGCWAAGFLILNLTRQSVEDEMVQKIRLQAYQLGFFYLLLGLFVQVIFNFIVSFWGFSGVTISTFSVLFLLNFYIFIAFHFQKFNNSQSI